MKEFVKKLISRLEEEKQRLRRMKNDTIALSDSEVIAIEEGAYNFCKEIVNKLAEEYNNGLIPCEVRLPETDKYVLCQGNHSQFIACIDSLDNKWRDDHYHTRTTIIAWMPLPASYKEKGNEE